MGKVKLEEILFFNDKLEVDTKACAPDQEGIEFFVRAL